MLSFPSQNEKKLFLTDPGVVRTTDPADGKQTYFQVWSKALSK